MNDGEYGRGHDGDDDGDVCGRGLRSRSWPRPRLLLLLLPPLGELPEVEPDSC